MENTSSVSIHTIRDIAKLDFSNDIVAFDFFQ